MAFHWTACVTVSTLGLRCKVHVESTQQHAAHALLTYLLTHWCMLSPTLAVVGLAFKSITKRYTVFTIAVHCQINQFP